MESSLLVRKYIIEWNAETTTKYFLVIFSMIFYLLHQSQFYISFIMKEQISSKDTKKRLIPTVVLENKDQLPYIAMGTGKITDEQTLTKLLRKGLQLGCCKHIDTGRIYNNEIPLGKAIKTVINQGRWKRQDLFIATKLHNHITLDPVVQLKQALALMQLDYVDLFYVHWPFLDMDEKGDNFTHKSLEQCWSQFEQCVKKGYTKYLGLSNFNGQMINQLLTFCRIKPLALQVEINPYNPQYALAQTAQKHGIHVFAYSPLGKGASYIKKQFNLLQEPIIKELSQKYEKSAGQIILKSCLYRNIAVIPKTCNIDRLEENCKSGQIEISQADFNKIQSIGKRNRIFNGVFKYICAFDY